MSTYPWYLVAQSRLRLGATRVSHRWRYDDKTQLSSGLQRLCHFNLQIATPSARRAPYSRRFTQLFLAVESVRLSLRSPMSLAATYRAPFPLGQYL